MDDDVQYLGTNFATLEPLDGSCRAQESVTGITLHVERCEDKPAHDITFHRSRSSYVNIGRKSGSDDKSMRRENDDHNIVFACQVVSARHAKLVLSDGGQIYVLDLHSRHGTHLSRRGEAAPRMLKAEVATVLADGDILTFGKVVGAGSYLVSPVTVRVELITSNSSPKVSSPLRVLTPINSLSHAVSRARKLSSGRYGLFVPPSYIESESPHSTSSLYASSDEASSPSDHESDAEEVQPYVPLLLRDSQEKASVKIPAFRSFIKDIYTASISRSPSIMGDLNVPLVDAPGSPFSSVEVLSQPSPVVVVINPAPESRSQSPMELSTPSPSPPSEAQQSEPPVIGAWPASRPESPQHSVVADEPPKFDAPTPEPEPEPAQPSITQSKTSELFTTLTPRPPFLPVEGPFSHLSTAFDVHPSMLLRHPPHQLPLLAPPSPPPYLHRMPLHPVLADRVGSELKATIKSVKEQVTALGESVTGLKSRQSFSEEDIIDLQSHVHRLEPDSERLLCRINMAERNIASLSSLQSQVNTLRSRLDAPEPRPAEAHLSDVKACAEALNNLVFEMKALREDTEKRIEEKMEAISTARTEALNLIATEVEVLNSLKRKRTDDDDDDDLEHQVSPDVVTDAVTGQAAPTPVPNVGDDATPSTSRPQKRAKMAMYAVAQTAVTMAIGAAATWSALAFA
ncbi:hypothetical protein PAXRUDRAFT_826698 [Paxillus rubicundulus Ve08.2h10]|uniref:FHA domain-containing protein n=1 Tax=Paxillus rubicundulus Ve08.2h10 TaxID=930991 RepID=A0A0D0DE73_9AGAM|nr:hypothetical protein PAXRUDRAFT_826698 [Paxillus rubicundulus Ve08.2h10]